MLCWAVIGPPAIAQGLLDLMSKDVVYSGQQGLLAYDTILTNTGGLFGGGTEILVNEASNFTWSGDFNTIGSTITGPIVHNNRLDGLLNVMDQSILTFKSSGNPRITLPQNTGLLNSVIVSAGGFRLQSRTTAGIAGNGPSNITAFGVVIGGLNVDQGSSVTEQLGPFSTFKLEVPVELGSGTSQFFGRGGEFTERVTLSGGTASWFSGGTGKSLRLESLQGYGTIASAGTYDEVNATGMNRTLTLGLAGAAKDVIVEQLSVANSTSVILRSRAVLGNVTLQGTRIVASDGVTFGFSDRNTTSDLRGEVIGRVTSKVGAILDGNNQVIESFDSRIQATGGLSLGDTNLSQGVGLEGTLDVGSHKVTLKSSDVVAVADVILDGGQLVASTGVGNRLRFADDATLRGHGFVFGNIIADPTQIVGEGNLLFEGSFGSSGEAVFDVGDRHALLVSESPIQFVNTNPVLRSDHLRIAGGEVSSKQILNFNIGTRLVGHGVVNAALTGAETPPPNPRLPLQIAGGQITVEGGDLTIGDGTMRGVDFDGNISIGSNRLIINDGDRADLGGLTTLNRGWLIARNGIFVEPDAEIRGQGFINAPISGFGGGTRNLNATGAFNLNDLAAGFKANDGDDITVLTNQRFSLGSTQADALNLNGGIVRSANGFLLENFGASNFSFSLNTGSSLLGSVVGDTTRAALTAEADVTVGDARRTDGVQLSRTGVNTINSGRFDLELWDSDGVEANRLSVLGGTLRSNSGFLARGLAPRATGVGVIFGELDPAYALEPSSSIAELDGLDVGDDIATVLSNAPTLIKNLNMQEGGRLKSAPNAGFAFGNTTEVFAGTVDGSVLGFGTSFVTQGDTTLGDLTSPSGVAFIQNSSITVGNQQRLTLLDQNEAEVGTVVLNGGEIATINGLAAASFGGGLQAALGNGLVRGEVNSNFTLAPIAPHVRTRFLDVGADKVTVLSTETAHFDGASVSIDGGTLKSANGFLFETAQGVSNVTGNGFLDGAIQSGHTVTAEGGTLVLGDASSISGVRLEGLLEVGRHTVRLRDANRAQVGNTTLNGGTLEAANGLEFRDGTTVSGLGLIRGMIEGPVTLDGMGIYSRSSIAVGNDFVTLLTSSAIVPNVDITSDGGALSSSRGVFFLTGDSSFVGHGSINSTFLTNDRTDVIATGRLRIGTLDGSIRLNGNLVIQNHPITLAAADFVELSGQTQILGGELFAFRGIELQSGGSLNGYGTIDASVVNNGVVHAIENNPDKHLAFVREVRGTGSYTGNVRFEGQFSPGASPAAISMQNVTFAETSILEIELSGLLAGTEYDQLLISDDAFLDGSLGLIILDNFESQLGDRFEILDVGGNLSGQFRGLEEGATFAALNDPTQRFSISYFGGDGNDVVLTSLGVVPEPSSLLLALVGMVFGWKRSKSRHSCGN